MTWTQAFEFSWNIFRPILDGWWVVVIISVLFIGYWWVGFLWVNLSAARRRVKEAQRMNDLTKTVDRHNVRWNGKQDK